MNLDLSPFSMRASYERVQPGFQSLGTSRIRSDFESFSVRPQLALMNGRIRLGGSFALGQDNLLGNKLTTSQRNRYGFNGMFRLSQQFALNTNYNRFASNVSSSAETQQSRRLEQNVTSQSFMLQPNFTFITGSYSHNISLAAVYELMENSFASDTVSSANSTSFNNINTSLTYGITFPSGFNLNASGNFLRSNTQVTKNTNLGFTLGTGFGLFQQKLRLNVNAGLSVNSTNLNDTGNAVGATERQSSQLYGNASASYRLPNNDTIRLTVRNTNNFVQQGRGNTFQEVQARLRYQHQF